MSILNFLAGIPVNANLRIKITQLEIDNKTLKEQNASLHLDNEALKKQNAELETQVKRLTERIHSNKPSLSEMAHSLNG